MSKESKETKSPSLFELAADCSALMDFGYTEEDREAFMDTLEPIVEAIDEKSDGYCAVISRFNGQVEMIKVEIERLTARKQTIENSVKRMKDALLYAMNATGRTEIRTDTHTIKIAGNGGKQPLEITGEVPDSFTRITVEPDREKIRAALEEGKELDFAELKPRGVHLSIR